MKTCLKLYHHSSFNDGKSPARRINVELTYVLPDLPSMDKPPRRNLLRSYGLTTSSAGGGGKSENRKAKIYTKNRKLDEERKREKKQKGKGASSINGHADDSGQQEQSTDDFAGIHPSRRPRMR